MSVAFPHNSCCRDYLPYLKELLLGDLLFADYCLVLWNIHSLRPCGFSDCRLLTYLLPPSCSLSASFKADSPLSATLCSGNPLTLFSYKTMPDSFYRPCGGQRSPSQVIRNLSIHSASVDGALPMRKALTDLHVDTPNLPLQAQSLHSHLYLPFFSSPQLAPHMRKCRFLSISDTQNPWVGTENVWEGRAGRPRSSACSPWMRLPTPHGGGWGPSQQSRVSARSLGCLSTPLHQPCSHTNTPKNTQGLGQLASFY